MTVLDITVATGGDDGFWRPGTFNDFNNTAATLSFGRSNASNTVNSFMRMAVPIDKDTVPDVAYIRFVSGGDRSTTIVNVRIRGVAADNPAAPGNFSAAQNATRTTASTDWSNIPAWATNETRDTPSIVSVLTELFSRSGWVSGNHVLLYVEDNGSTAALNTDRIPASFDNPFGRTPPTLHIEDTPPVQEITAAHISSTTTLHGATLDAEAAITADDITSTAQLHGATLVPGEAALAADHLASSLTLFGATLATIDNDTPTVGAITHDPNPVVPA